MAAEGRRGRARAGSLRIELSAVDCDESERAGALLVLDEADAFLGMRTKIEDEHDRCAILEVTYVLRGVESFSGPLANATDRDAARSSASAEGASQQRLGYPRWPTSQRA
ncbi:MAG: hypothetical protein ACRDMU_02365 [Gaiellaceae bacterium]